MKYLITILLMFNFSTLNAATLKFNNGFESGMKAFKCSGNCPKTSTAQKKSGKYSGNFTLTPKMSTKYRTELVLGDKGRFDFHKEYWLSFDYRYEDWKKDKSPEFAPFQIHTSPSKWEKKCYITQSAAASAPFFMVSENDKVKFVTFKGKNLWSGSIQKKKWINITVHFRLSSGNDGFIEAWKDGVKLGKVNGPNSHKSDKCGKMRPSYLKMGIYKWNWKNKATGSSRRQLFIDNVRVATGSNGYSLVSSVSSKGKVTSKPKGKPKVTSEKQPSKSSNKKTDNNGKVTVIKITGSKPKGKSKTVKYNFNNKLFSYWDMTGNGRTIFDRSGNGHKGKLAYGARVTKSGVYFGGRNDYINVGKFNIKGRALTISGWFNSENLKNCEHRDCRLISKATGVKDINHTFMVSTVSVGSKTRLRFRLKTNGKVSTLIASSGNLQKNKWTHFAAVYDGHTMKLFKDGKQVGAMKKNGNITPSKAQVWIGGNPTRPSYRPWKGRIDELRIYNTALSKKQIVTLANE